MVAMRRAPLVFAIALATFARTARCQQGETLDCPELLRRMVDVEWLWSPPPGERCVQWSSFDRSSEKGPGNAGAWYANDDRGKYVRVEERDGRKEHVLVDAAGPGCVARIWSANPTGTLHFDVDGSRVWSVDFAALCSGKVDGVPEPIAGMRSKGGNCHLPIPFAKSLKMSATAADLYYHVDVVTFAKGMAVESFSLTQLEGSRDVVLATARSLLAEPTPFVDRSHPAVTRVEVPLPAVVTGVEIVVRPKGENVDLARVLAGIRLVVKEHVEDRTDVLVDVPLPAFFAAGPEWRPWRGAMLGVRSDRSAWCRWPMPLPFGGVIELVADGDTSGVELVLDAQLDMRSVRPPFDRDALRFRASYHLVKGTPTRPFTDHLVLDAKGRGRFVGCSLLVQNPSRIWWGEGDEKFTVDGEAFPSWFGTGTEDYFGYAWCSTELFASPFHAQIQCDGPMNFGFTQLHRTHVLDSVPFQTSFRFDLERWHWVENTKVDYATVAYWYGGPGATSGLPPVPPAAERAMQKLASPPIWIAENVLEGEALRVVSCSGGAHTVQDTALFEKTFSADGVRCWFGGKTGDLLVLAVPVAEAGSYRATIAFGQNHDAGVVQCSLGGARLGEPFDGYHEKVRSTGPRVLGEVTLPAGDAELRLELTGANPAAKPVHMVAIDYVRLERIE